MLRPRATRWFEILAARDDATLVLEALARTGAVELEARSGAPLPADPAEVAPLLAAFSELSSRCRPYWPEPQHCRPSAFPEAPVPTLRRCLATIRAWALEAEPVIRKVQRAEAERGELKLWQRVLDAPGAEGVDPCLLAGAGPLVSVRLVVLPTGTEPASVLPTVAPGLEMLTRTLFVDGQALLLAAGRPEALQALAQRVSLFKGSMHALPPWLQADAMANRRHARQALERVERELVDGHTTLQDLDQRHALACALGDVHRVQWVLDNVKSLESGALLCWITGWTSADDALLEAAVDASGVRALLRLPPRAPETVRAPLLFANPPWAQPFEVFARALGMPSGTEADPSVLLAIAVPLMFGYMFGDVGQGLVIAAAGFFLRRRFPLARLFIAGGLSATLFGFVFGSVFSLHRWSAWWIQPLDDPLAVLVAPLIGGALLLSLGLALAALEAHWRGELARWMATEAGLLAAYLALVVAPLWPPALAVAAAGVLLFCLGHAALQRHATAAFAALGEAAERLLQILINTLSFARVGAFALAHAGLSSAIVALMDAAPSALTAGLVLLVGNLVVIVLEGLVVSIQTTRLVLFEFFTRFLQGQGRVFRPLQRPPSSWKEG